MIYHLLNMPPFLLILFSVPLKIYSYSNWQEISILKKAVPNTAMGLLGSNKKIIILISSEFHTNLWLLLKPGPRFSSWTLKNLDQEKPEK